VVGALWLRVTQHGFGPREIAIQEAATFRGEYCLVVPWSGVRLVCVMSEEMVLFSPS
jgi:hypothetical protein